MEAGREPGSLCLPLAPDQAGALGSLRVVPCPGPCDGVVLARLLQLRSPAACARGGLPCADPVTEASGFLYRPSFDKGLRQFTGAVSCGRRHLPLRVGGRHARVPRVCACACSSWSGRVGGPSGAPHLSFGRFVLLLCSAPSRLGLPVLRFSFVFSFLVFFPGSSLFLSPSPLAPPLSPAFCASRPWVPWALAPCVSSCPPPFFVPFCFFCVFLFYPVVRSPSLRSATLLSLAVAFSCFRPRVRSVLVLRSLRPPPLLFFPCPPPPRPPCPLCLGVLVPAVAHRCAFCYVCPGVSCRASLALSPLCGARLHCGGRCARFVLFIWSVLFQAPGPLGHYCVLRSLTWCSVVWCCAALLGAWCAVLLRAVPFSPASCRVVRRRLLCAAVLCCASAPVSCSCVERSHAVLLLPACLLFSQLAPPPGVRAVPCAVCCRLAVLPFCLVLCGAVLPCSVLRVVVWCPTLLCCGLPRAGRVVRLPWWRCVLISGFAVCCLVPCPWVLCCAVLLCPVLCCCVLCCFA